MFRALFRLLHPGPLQLRHETGPTLRSGVALSTVGILVQGLVRLGYSVIIGNVLGRTVLGSVNAGIALALFASLLIPSATALAANKHVAQARGAGDLGRAAAVGRHLGRISLASMAALGVVSALVAPSLIGADATEATLVGLLAASYSGYVFVRGYLFGAGEILRATVWDVVTAFVALFLLGALLWLDATAWILLPLVLCYGGYAAFSWPRGGTDTALSSGAKTDLRDFLGVGLVNSVAIGGFLQLTMAGAQYWDRATAGAFAAALSLATPASLLSRSLAIVLFPSVSAARGRGDERGARRQIDRATRGLVVTGLLAFGPLALVSPMLIQIVYRREGFELAELLLPILLGAVFLSHIATAATNSLLSRERRWSRVVAITGVIGALVGVLWWAAAAPQGGVVHIAVGFLAGSAIIGLVPLAVAWSSERQAWGGLAVRTGLAGALAVGGVALIHTQDLGVLWQLGLAGAYAVIAALLSLPEIRALLASR